MAEKIFTSAPSWAFDYLLKKSWRTSWRPVPRIRMTTEVRQQIYAWKLETLFSAENSLVVQNGHAVRQVRTHARTHAMLHEKKTTQDQATGPSISFHGSFECSIANGQHSSPGQKYRNLVLDADAVRALQKRGTFPKASSA